MVTRNQQFVKPNCLTNKMTVITHGQGHLPIKGVAVGLKRSVNLSDTLSYFCRRKGENKQLTSQSCSIAPFFIWSLFIEGEN